jgi:hypothetical protein
MHFLSRGLIGVQVSYEIPTEIKPSIIDIRIDPDEVPAGAPRRFESLVMKHPELGEKKIPTTTFPKKAT